uniref:Predicted protein n=1 Tax=Hordeum vulgare subsp. vulgare TaxID=112509 RepID=F2E250_HORVV|nr:predicted protein [Hordeum vulgare subsp. vulgare]
MMAPLYIVFLVEFLVWAKVVPLRCVMVMYVP